MVAVPVVATAAPTPTEASDPTTATRYARQSGTPVLVTSATTETDEVRANPDGSMTLVQHVAPVRVKRGDGWTPVDLTLERKPDGTIAPKAAPVDVAFSAGGTGSGLEPLAKVARGGSEVGLRWQGDLPEPRIDGSGLTYAEVLPGVDLKVEASLTGFGQVLVVKNRDAARNLGTIAFPTHAESARVEDRSGASLVVKDDAGKPVFAGDASRMWDSSSRSAANQTEGPADGDRQAGMAVAVTPDAVSITPDRAFLDDPKTTYPVLLDPEYSCTNCGKTHHAVVQDQWPNAHNYDVTSGDLGDLKAGFLNKNSLGAPNNGVSRTYLQMNTSALLGKYIASATLHTKVVSSYSCSPSPTELWLVGWIDSTVTWNNQPGWTRALSENNRSNNPGYCPSDGGADFDALSGVREAVGGGWSAATFMLKAKYENQLDTSWRRFDLNPYLEVKYNSYPNAPTDLGVDGSTPTDAKPCVVGANRPYVSSKTPRLRARLSDPDGGMLDAGFRLFVGPSTGYTWNGQDIRTGNVPSGSFAEVTVPTGYIGADGVYSYQLWAGDYQLSTFSTTCEFAVDSTVPNTPAVTSTDYPTSGFNGSPGKSGTFTFKVNGNTGAGGTMDVANYGWSLNNDVPQKTLVPVSTADGTTTATITPTQTGVNTLYVTAYDKAGNRSGTNAVYQFSVAAATGPTGEWKFNESAGTSAFESTPGNRALALTAGATFNAGYASNSLYLNGSTAYGATTPTVLDTTRSFTVSAWAKLDRKNGYFTAISQDGGQTSPFALQYRQDIDRWTMTAYSADVAAPAGAFATSLAAPEIGVWYQLMGTYAPDTGKVSLYVDGKPQNTATMPNLWKPTGGLVVGAGRWTGVRTEFFPGAIDYVRVWDRTLTASEAADANNIGLARAYYNLDERTGNQTKDEVSGQYGTVAAGATWGGVAPDPDDPNQVLSSEQKWLDLNYTSTGEVSAPRPNLLRTDRSYTVSAWVKLTSADQWARAAVSMGDATHAPFILGYRPETGKWGFLMSKGPSGDGWIAMSDAPAQTGQWVQLTGVFDAPRGRMTLYVDGVKQTTTFQGTTDGTGVWGWNASGPLYVGRTLWGGNRSDQWLGSVDDVRVFSGVLTGSEIQQRRLSSLHN
ncbi:LamG-like jellyroll fold domain-containing protein [Actinosynnema sp. NPDC020468]|uniref:LamG-like jellyroll fold domain-containing protein n=1 Tax=Actinosynnema sp. NPDC020468 TaxID=3154488 RepID=UPI0033FF88F6